MRCQTQWHGLGAFRKKKINPNKSPMNDFAKKNENSYFEYN